jgi:hypothetical protein
MKVDRIPKPPGADAYTRALLRLRLTTDFNLVSSDDATRTRRQRIVNHMLPGIQLSLKLIHNEFTIMSTPVPTSVPRHTAHQATLQIGA